MRTHQTSAPGALHHAKMQVRKTKKRRLIIVLAIVIIIGMLAYAAADRFLIEHVEISDVKQYESSASASAKSSQEDNKENDINDENFKIYTSDDWNYDSSELTINVKEITSGIGEDALTYYVADVQLNDGTDLKSAFAKNQFGNNIIEYTSEIAEENNAIFAINGDYYGFRDDGIIIRNGVIYRDEPARTGLAIYKDGTMEIYDETQTSAEELLKGGVWNTLSFGPALLKDSQVVDNLGDMEVDTNFGNHSIQGNQPRTGIGIIDKNHFVFIVVDGRSEGYSEGVSLTEFAQIFQDLGCTEAYNLDGGGSSTMYFMGRVVNNPLGKNKERGVSDILYIATLSDAS